MRSDTLDVEECDLLDWKVFSTEYRYIVEMSVSYGSTGGWS